MNTIIAAVPSEPMEYTKDPYSSLRGVLEGAYDQACAGKGKERHAYSDEEPFENQLICEMGRRLGGARGPLYQAVKKIYESDRLDTQAAVRELYGAINYIAAAIILRQEKDEVGQIVNRVV